MSEKNIINSEIDYSIPGLRITFCSNPDPWEIVVQSSEKQKDWMLEDEDALPGEKRPPTALRYRDVDYLVMVEEETESGFVYRLKRPGPNEVHWHTVLLDPESWRAAQEEKAEFKKMMKQDKVSSFYDFLLGWIPARMLEPLSEKWGFGVEDACRRNAMLQYVVFLCLSVLALINMFAGFYSGIGGGFGVTVLYFLMSVEGLMRKFHIQLSEKPYGFTPLELLDSSFMLIIKKISKH